MPHQEEFRTVFHRVLAIPFVYELVQTIVGSAKIKKTAMQLAFQDGKTHSFLDLGCGTGEVIRYIPSQQLSRYVGLDVNESYIRQAEQKFSDPKFSFFSTEIHEAQKFIRGEKFDLVYLGGFLHHLNDESSNQLLSLLPSFLSPGGCAITMDPIFYEGQGLIARTGARLDRGKYVRNAPEYLALHKAHFQNVEPHVYHDMLIYPHTIQITVCRV